MISLLHDDEALLAVDKPAGLAAIPERDPAADCLLARLEAGDVPAVPASRLFVVHRLDKEVSGVLVFARTAAAHRHLCLQFEQRTARKTYVALVHGSVPADDGVIDAPLRSFGSGRTGVDAQRGKPSTTKWRVLQRFAPADGPANFTLLELAPLTGRRHQLRAHLHHLGHAIAGDARYGDATSRAASSTVFPRLMLHARRLQLVHPASGAPLVLEAPLPPAFLALLPRSSGGVATPAP